MTIRRTSERGEDVTHVGVAGLEFLLQFLDALLDLASSTAGTFSNTTRNGKTAARLAGLAASRAVV